jgi:hypothetical protein
MLALSRRCLRPAITRQNEARLLDRRSSAGRPESLAPASAPGAPDRGASGARSGTSGAVNSAAEAFGNLTQWEPVAGSKRRENLVADSAFGDPRRVGVQSYRELSGFQMTVGAQRRRWRLWPKP